MHRSMQLPVSTLLEILPHLSYDQRFAVFAGVSTLLEILHQAVSDIHGAAVPAEFQPFLRFYCNSSVIYKGWNWAFQPFLRFYGIVVLSGAEPKDLRVSTLPEILRWKGGYGSTSVRSRTFQPFLRFYRPGSSTRMISTPRCFNPS